MKVLKKLELRDYKVLDHEQMRMVRGGSEKKKEYCADYESERRCVRKGKPCSENGVVGTCDWLYGDMPYEICGCVGN